MIALWKSSHLTPWYTRADENAVTIMRRALTRSRNHKLRCIIRLHNRRAWISFAACSSIFYICRLVCRCIKRDWYIYHVKGAQKNSLANAIFRFGPRVPRFFNKLFCIIQLTRTTDLCCKQKYSSSINLLSEIMESCRQNYLTF